MEQTNAFLRIEAVLIETSQPENLAAFYRQAFQLPAPVPVGRISLGFQQHHWESTWALIACRTRMGRP
jgi:hypothetical protein